MVIQCGKKRKFLNANPFYPNIKKVYCVVIVEGKVNRHKNSAEYVGAVFRRCCTNFVLLKILQNSQENTSARVFF